MPAKKLVTWKDEGSKGPCFVYHDRSEFGNLWGYGGPRAPESVEDKGWMTEAQAEKIAEELDADFMSL